MARYYTVQIGSIHLTSTGLEGGLPCRVEIQGLTPITPAYRRTVIQAIEGPPAVQLFDNRIGEAISMVILNIGKAVYEELIEAINDADASTGIINIKLSGGDLGEFDFDCVVESIDQPGQFRNGMIPELALVWRIHAVNEIEEEEE